jgi:hypothetical protein
VGAHRGVVEAAAVRQHPRRLGPRAPGGDARAARHPPGRTQPVLLLRPGRRVPARVRPRTVAAAGRGGGRRGPTGDRRPAAPARRAQRGGRRRRGRPAPRRRPHRPARRAAGRRPRGRPRAAVLPGHAPARGDRRGTGSGRRHDRRTRPGAGPPRPAGAAGAGRPGGARRGDRHPGRRRRPVPARLVPGAGAGGAGDLGRRLGGAARRPSPEAGRGGALPRRRHGLRDLVGALRARPVLRAGRSPRRRRRPRPRCRAAAGRGAARPGRRAARAVDAGAPAGRDDGADRHGGAGVHHRRAPDAAGRPGRRRDRGRHPDGLPADDLGPADQLHRTRQPGVRLVRPRGHRDHGRPERAVRDPLQGPGRRAYPAGADQRHLLLPAAPGVRAAAAADRGGPGAPGPAR